MGSQHPYMHPKTSQYSHGDSRLVEEGIDEWATHIERDNFSIASDLFKLQQIERIECNSCHRVLYIFQTAPNIFLEPPKKVLGKPHRLTLNSLLDSYFGKF